MPRPLDYARPDSQAPRPPLILVINTAAWLVLVTGWLLVGALAPADPKGDGAAGVALAACVWTPGFALGALLWASVFRCNRWATGLLAGLQFAGGGALVVGAVGNAGEGIVAGDVRFGLLVGSVTLGVAAYVFFSAWLSLRWFRRLPRADESS